MSLGAVNATMVANHNPAVNQVILLAPGHCLAESLWTGALTEHLRKEFEGQGINLPQLIKHWKDLKPENNIDGLKGKRISVYLAKNDEAIKYPCGKDLVEAMRREGLEPKVTESSWLGHYGTLLKYFLFPSDIP